MELDTSTEGGLVNDIITSIMTPGYTATGVIQAMFYAFYALFATLTIMVIITGGNPHVIALLLLSVCLFIAIRWFLAELDNIKRQNGETTKDRDASAISTSFKKKSKKTSKKGKKQAKK
ncbi:hypothetical protein BCR42DRAFT_364345 [Absidia repens]|uniref:ER protein Pkr1-domain-containing protein n=1 Tax=Absidia repens TaxID=90262 RepID=A0A1X2J1W3_9FUNG|nr:hypothetical protein BCR42DRAFT_364345 [Absidia repens]